MVEQWISAAQALDIARDPVSICKRLHAGLVEARAKLIVFGEEKQENVAVAREFWWAQGHQALEQNWDTGDFSTSIDNTKQISAFGVSMALSDVLEMTAPERRPLIARSLSVVGNDNWMSAAEAYAMLQAINLQHIYNPEQLMEQARFGFVIGRAVLAQGVNDRVNHFDWHWQEREWDIATWFWTYFTSGADCNQNWAMNRFIGKGLGPKGLTDITLSGVYFARDSVMAWIAPAQEPITQENGSKPRGPRPYDWTDTICAIWGKLHRGELLPETQADVERAIIQHLRSGDKEPGESTARKYAGPIWAEFSKP